MIKKLINASLLLIFLSPPAFTAPMLVRPPVVSSAMPGMAQLRAVQMSRHQARTLLYHKALEELRKNPAAADVPPCKEGTTPQQSLCLAPPATPPSQPDEPSRSGRRIALLIGSNAYPDPIPELNTPLADIESVGEILRKNYGFDVRTIKNGTKEQTIQAINLVAADAEPNDSVLIFYAGHGYLMDETNMGYWIPVNASVNSPENWISNSDITKLLKAIPARQLLLISDSCYSGTLANEKKFTTSIIDKIRHLFRSRSVTALSSGGEEPVSDAGRDGHSIFAWHLIKVLQNESHVFLGSEVYNNVHQGVVKEFPQEPQYGEVISAGHTDGEDYLFSRIQP